MENKVHTGTKHRPPNEQGDTVLHNQSHVFFTQTFMNIVSDAHDTSTAG